MSKKTLLKEATVRRFMKLADVGNLTDTFINEYGQYQDDEPVEDELVGGEDELPPEAGEELPPVEDELPGDEGPEAEVAPEEGLEEEEVTISEEDRDVLAQAAGILSKIAGEPEGEELEEPMPDLGGEEVGGEEEEPMMEGADLSTKGGNKTNPWAKKGPNTAKMTTVGDAGLASKGGTSGKMFEDSAEEGDIVEENEELDEVELVDEDELVKEVTRRVAARLRSVLKSRK